MPSNEQRRQTAKRKLDRQMQRRAQRAKRNRTIAVIVSVLAVVVVVGGGYLLSTMDFGPDGVDPATDIPSKRVEPVERPKALDKTVSCEYSKKEKAKPAKKVDLPPSKDISARGSVPATMDTSQGEIGLTLDRSLAPCAVNNFTSLAKQDYFSDTKCHRLTTEGLQVLQCGDPSGTGSGGPGYSFKDEVFKQEKYGRGMLAMANSGPDTNGSQFFLVYGDAKQLPPKYSIFGTISDSGLDVIDDIAEEGIESQAPTAAPQQQQRPGDGAPAVEVKVNNVSIGKDDAAK